MNKDNPEIEYNNYIVTFLDLLGQKEVFKSLEKFQVIEFSEEFEKAIKAVHADATHNVKTMRESFIDFFNGIASKRPVPDSIPKDKTEVFEEMRKLTLKYKTFSDCMQFYVSLKTDRFHCQAMNSVFAMLNSTGGFLLGAFAEKKVFRAGIDVGIGIEIEDNEVYGPALFRAYDLESRVAQYPRIVVGDALINYLINLANEVPQALSPMPEDIAICKSLAERSLGFLTKDIDGYVILDYLGDNFSTVLKRSIGNDKFQIIFDLAFEFIQSEYSKFKDAKDSKMSQRYHWLYQYFLNYKDKTS